MSSKYNKNKGKQSKKREAEAITQSGDNKRKKLFSTHVEMTLKSLHPGKTFDSHEIQILDLLRSEPQKTLILESNGPFSYLPITMEILHEMIVSYFKPQDGTFALFITPDDYSAYSIHSQFEMFLNSTLLKPLSLASLYLRNFDIEDKGTKGEIGFLARREKGSIITGSLKNLPYFIRGKGSTLIKLQKLRYIFIVDPLGFIYSDSMRSDLSHLLNRLAKSGRKFQIVFLSQRSLPKPANQFVVDLLKSPISSLNDTVSNSIVEEIGGNQSTRRMKYYCHEIANPSTYISTLITMIKSAFTSQKNTKIVLYIASKNVLKIVFEVLTELSIPIIGAAIAKPTSPRIVCNTLKEFNEAKNGVLLAAEMFASGRFSFPDSDYFIFLHPPIDKEGFKSVGEIGGTVTGHKIILTPMGTLESLKNYYSNLKSIEKLNLKNIQTQPHEKVTQAIKNVLDANREQGIKASEQFETIVNQRMIRVLNRDESHKLKCEDARKNFCI